MNTALLHCAFFAMALDTFLLSNSRANEKGTESKGFWSRFWHGTRQIFVEDGRNLPGKGFFR